MARVFINASTLGSFGGRTYLRNLLHSSTDQAGRHDISLLVPSDELSVFQDLASERVALMEGPRRRGFPGWRRLTWSQLILPLIVRQRKPDVLVSVGGVDVFAASALFGVPSVVIVQNSAPWTVPHLLTSRARAAYLRLSVRLSAHTADRLVAMSETAKQEMCQAMGIEVDRVFVASPGGAAEQFDSQAVGRTSVLASLGISRPYLLSVSSIFAYKNYHRLIEGYSALRRSLTGAPDLLIVGEVKDREYFDGLLQQIAELGLGSVVRLVGRVPYEDLPAVYANAEAYVFPSLCESFGLTPLEAMACGVPVTAARASAIPEICGDAALYFHPLDPSDIARALESVLTDGELREKLVSKGRLQAREFSWDKNARETWAIIEGVSGS